MYGFKRLAELGKIPIAAGENEYARYGFREMIQHGAVHVVQPDVTRVGGISEWIKVSNMAAAWHLPCVPHGVQEVHVSLVAAVSNAPMVEYFTEDHYLQSFLSRLFIKPAGLHVPRDSYVDAPREPGLELAYDVETAERYTVKSV
jgi:D-arabinonate dehydratase